MKEVDLQQKSFLAKYLTVFVLHLLGVGIGILPGIGGGVSCMISYTVAKIHQNTLKNLAQVL